VESSVFIAWVKGEVVEKKLPDGQKVPVARGAMATNVLELAERGYYKIHTATFTLAECHKPKGYDPLDPRPNKQLLDYFENDFIVLVTVDQEVALEANRLASTHNLDAADAVHLAAALRAGCDVLLAWDEPLSRRASGAPGIRIEEPDVRADDLRDLLNSLRSSQMVLPLFPDTEEGAAPPPAAEATAPVENVAPEAPLEAAEAPEPAPSAAGSMAATTASDSPAKAEDKKVPGPGQEQTKEPA
jgi:predicted nucleic acid-binding protein